MKFTGTESYVETDGSSLSVMDFRFAREAVLTTADDGFYFSSTDESDIGFYSLDGDLQRLARLARPHRPLTAAAVERVKEERLEGMEGMREGLRQTTQAMLDNLPFPESMPSFSEILVDVEGNLWVKDYQAWRTDPPRWFVFDPTGRLLGELSMPVGFQVHQVGSDYVLGHRTDDLGVEYVELHRLEKG